MNVQFDKKGKLAVLTPTSIAGDYGNLKQKLIY